jgi:hypothetical protein
LVARQEDLQPAKEMNTMARQCCGVSLTGRGHRMRLALRLVVTNASGADQFLI